MLTIQHEWSGADWLESNLRAARECEARRRGKKKRKIAERISPFGRAVADLLGFVWRGLYHLPDDAIIGAAWDSDRWITIKLYKGHDLATYDFSELSQIVIASHDLSIRFSVRAEFGGSLVLGFEARAREGDIAARHPYLEPHVEKIRALYKLVEIEIPQPAPTIAAEEASAP